MRAHALTALLATACAPIPAEREERDRLILSAAQGCARQYSGMLVTKVDRDGRVYLDMMDRGDLPAFERCYREALAKMPGLKAFSTGQLAPRAAATSVAIEMRGSAVLVPALVNGVKAILLVDTGAAITIVRPSLAQRAGIEPGQEAPRLRVVVVGGGQISVPLVRARTLGINDAAVDAIDVGVYEALPNLPDVDGLLGSNFLNHFRVTIDRDKRVLVLAPLRPSKPF